MRYSYKIITLSLIIPKMATYCTSYVPTPNKNRSMLTNNRNPVTTPVHIPFYTPNMPQIPFNMKPPGIPPQIYPRVGTSKEYTQPQTTHLLPFNYYEPAPSYRPDIRTNFAADKNIPHQENIPTVNIISEAKSTDYTDKEQNAYFRLLSDLFPPVRRFPIDPNPIIDEFCKQPNIMEHAAWIMDLELGISRAPTTRLIPAYIVKYNSIQCKNTPTAIHPGFEICSEGFKRVLLFYYDSIMSTWYRGYVLVNNDVSVENFQDWLLKPIQCYGMCWPDYKRSLL